MLEPLEPASTSRISTSSRSRLLSSSPGLDLHQVQVHQIPTPTVPSTWPEQSSANVGRAPWQISEYFMLLWGISKENSVDANGERVRVGWRLELDSTVFHTGFTVVEVSDDK